MSARNLDTLLDQPFYLRAAIVPSELNRETEQDGDGDNGDDDDDDDDDPTLADVTMPSTMPPGITATLTNPNATLSQMDPSHTVSSTNGIGVVGAISGQVSSVTNGFEVSDGVIGIVAPDANTGVISGMNISVDSSHVATVTTTPDGNVSISFSTKT